MPLDLASLLAEVGSACPAPTHRAAERLLRAAGRVPWTPNAAEEAGNVLYWLCVVCAREGIDLEAEVLRRVAVVRGEAGAEPPNAYAAEVARQERADPEGAQNCACGDWPSEGPFRKNDGHFHHPDCPHAPQNLAVEAQRRPTFGSARGLVEVRADFKAPAEAARAAAASCAPMTAAAAQQAERESGVDPLPADPTLTDNEALARWEAAEAARVRDEVLEAEAWS